MSTLAKRLGRTAHLSILLRKARQLGLHDSSDLTTLAIVRGCQHHGTGQASKLPPVSDTQFSNEELAIGLLSPSLPYDPRSLRIGAQMLGRRGNQPRKLARLARLERAVETTRYVAEAGRQTEPQEPFWNELLAELDSMASRVRSELPPGVMPHPSRFRSETGLTNPRDLFTRGGPQMVWLRPATGQGSSA